jgi:hypothetical protein
VHGEARMLPQPRLHLGPLVGGVVVHDQVQIEVLLNGAVDLSQEAQEFPGPVARLALADDYPALYVERRKQGGRAMASLATTIVGLLSLEIASIGDTTAPGELKTEVARLELR